MRKYDSLVLGIDDESVSFDQFIKRMALGEPIPLTPVYTHYKDGEDPTDEFLTDQKVQMIILAIVAKEDCLVSITFKLDEIHEAFVGGEHTLKFNPCLICDEIPDDMYDPEFLAAEPQEDHLDL